MALMHCGLELSAGNQREHERLVFRQRGGELLVAARHKVLLTGKLRRFRAKGDEA
ncbi:MAG: hypothetical protein ABSF10_17990 [Verrucomicrobiota bacterium]